MTWLTKLPFLEFFFLYGASLILLSTLFLNPTSAVLISLFSIALVIDAGHVYLTFFRTYFLSSALQKGKLFGIFILVFLVIFLLFHFKIPFVWTAIVYFTFFHHIRQNYGIFKLYSKLSNISWKKEETTSILLNYLAFTGLHFKPNFKANLFTDHDLLTYPNDFIFLILKLLSLFLLLVFIKSSTTKLLKNKPALPYFLSLVIPTTINVLLFSLAPSIEKILIPMLVYHTLTYIWLTSDFHYWKGHFSNRFAITILLIISSIFIFGFVDSYFSDGLSTFNYDLLSFSDLIVLSLVTTPSVWHYIVDGLIWKNSDVDFSQYLKAKKM